MKISKLWGSLAKEKFSAIDELFLSNFRQTGNANNRLAAWDPFDKTMRYFKFLFFHQIQAKDSKFFSDYENIGITSVGNPVTLTSPSGDEINLDHFFTIEEYTFLNGNMDISQLNHVVEVGAGFGRTAQGLIKLVTSIDKYTIIDLPEILELSNLYLKVVLSKDEYKKVQFVNALKFHGKQEELNNIDLVINIDSFQEMPEETIRYYFDKVIKNARFFYSKNAVGKYKPELIGITEYDEEQLHDVFSLGLSTDIIDIFNEHELILARKKHAEQYSPSEQFLLVAQEPLGIFPYYLNLLYEQKISS